MAPPISTMTLKQAKASKVDMYFSIAGCNSCGAFLRVKIKSHFYVCPCRLKYRGGKRASPV